MRWQEFENDEAFQMTKEGFCEACEGQHWMDASGCYEDCEGFIEDYLETVKQFEKEDEQ